MNPAHVQGAEHVGQIGWDGREAAAVHGEDNHGRRVEAHQVEQRGIGRGRRGEVRDRQIQQRAEHEEGHIGHLAADVIRGRGPEKAPDHVEHRDHQHVGRCEGGGDHQRHQRAEDVRHHGFGHADHADPGGDVEAQHNPKLPELRRGDGPVDVHIPAADQRGAIRFGRPARRFPVRGRHPVLEGGDDHHQQIHQAQSQKGLRRPRIAAADHVQPGLAAELGRL